MNTFIRLNVTAEGQTEERFVKHTLSEYLAEFNISTSVRCVLTSRDKKKEYRGGLSNYEKAKRDILQWLKEDSNADARFTTMFDLYALPTNFPKFEEAKKCPPYERVQLLEEAFRDDIGDERFIPYIQLHEFETLILSDPEALLLEYFEHQRAVDQLVALLEEKKNAELINTEQAPSKRILALIPEYDKCSVGVDVVNKIGIGKLKECCNHFREWLQRLEDMQ